MPTPTFPRPDRPWQAADTLKNVIVMLDAARRQPAARWPSGCPATATSTSSGWRRQLEPAEAEAFTDEDFAAIPGWSRATSGPADLGRAVGEQDQVPGRPAGGHGTRWMTGANEPGRHVFDLVAAATSPPTA